MTKMPARFLLQLLALLLVVAGISIRAQQPVAPRLVFAHYMVTNQDYQGGSDPSQEKKIASYEREIQQAQSMGIDGFALNVGGWLKEPYYIRYTAQMFEAAVRLHSGFKLMFSADMCCGNSMEDIEDMMRRFAGNPRYASVYLQRDGRFVLTTFSGDKLGPATWVQMRIDLLRGLHPSTKVLPNILAPADGAPSNAPIRTLFLPAFFWGGEVSASDDVEQAVKEWGPALDGAFYWGIAGTPGSKDALDTSRSSAAYEHALHGAGKIYMAPVALQFWGANADRYFEYRGAAGMRQLWAAAIENHADWVEIITWNDFIEGTYVSPIDDPNLYPGANYLTSSGIPLNTQGYFYSHGGAADLLRYFIRWYKSGIPPAITEDEIFYFYRTQPQKTKAQEPSVDHRFGPTEDDVYVTANLLAPATLTVRSGSRVTTLQLPAGSTDVAAPFSAGEAPSFELSRSGATVLRGDGALAIEQEPQYRNFYYVTGVLRSVP